MNTRTLGKIFASAGTGGAPLGPLHLLRHHRLALDVGGEGGARPAPHRRVLRDQPRGVRTVRLAAEHLLPGVHHRHRARGAGRPRRRELRGREEGQELGPHQQEDLHARAPDKEHLGSLKEKVRAYAFLAPSDADYEQVDRLLQRYREQAPDRFEVVFKDPRKAPDLAQKYQLREGQTTLVLTRGSATRRTTPPSPSPTESPSRTSPTRCSS